MKNIPFKNVSHSAHICSDMHASTKYLEEVGDYSSDELVDAVLWCVGAVVVMARIL